MNISSLSIILPTINEADNLKILIPEITNLLLKMKIDDYEITQTSGDTKVKIDIGESNTDFPSATAVTNYEYEVREQDRKRKIRLLDPSFVDSFVDEHRKLMKESVI